MQTEIGRGTFEWRLRPIQYCRPRNKPRPHHARLSYSRPVALQQNQQERLPIDAGGRGSQRANGRAHGGKTEDEHAERRRAMAQSTRRANADSLPTGQRETPLERTL